MNKPVSKIDIAKTAAFTALEKLHAESVQAAEVTAEANGSRSGGIADRGAVQSRVGTARDGLTTAVKNWVDETVASRKK